MADAKSNYLENKILDHVLKNTSYTSPTTVYCALFTAAPGETGGGTEVTGGSYARQAVTFSTAASGESHNSADIVYTLMPAATVTHFGVYDASTAGNLLYYGAFSASKTTTSGDTLTIPASGLSISEL